MFSDFYYTKKHYSEKYWWFGSVVVTGPSFAGAYAIIVTYKPSGPTVLFDSLRGVTVDLSTTAIAEDADMAVVERIGRTATITGRPTGTIERVK